LPKIGKELKVTLRIYKAKDGVFSNSRFYAVIDENEVNQYIKDLLKEHSGLNHHHLDISL